MTVTMTNYQDAHNEGARRALLERLATGLAVIAEPHRYHWTCCWLSYTGPYGEGWGWQMCGGQMPGGLPYGPDGRRVTCGHWHHRAEWFLAGG
jgi:hypothetical protein